MVFIAARINPPFQPLHPHHQPLVPQPLPPHDAHAQLAAIHLY